MEKDTQNQQKLDQIGGAVEQQFHIKIAGDGRWFHEGPEIKRVELVSLFAGLLRREDDGAYYLVTPVEEVEVDVALHPLMVVDATRVDDTWTYPELRRCFLSR